MIFLHRGLCHWTSFLAAKRIVISSEREFSLGIANRRVDPHHLKSHRFEDSPRREKKLLLFD